jgi:hypothetical protein
LKRTILLSGVILFALVPMTSQVCVDKRVACLNESCSEERISSWENLTIVRTNNNRLFLQDSDGVRSFLYEGKKSCSPAAAILNKSKIYIESCSGTFVADTSGRRVYKMQGFKYWDIVPNRLGTRFAVFERGRSAWHEFGQGTYDKLRLLVYETDNGEKLFDHKWAASQTEHPGQERIGLSEDGSTLYLCPASGPSVEFRIPTRKRP